MGLVESSWSRDWTGISCIGRPILYHWATREALNNCISEIYELCDVIKPKQINTTYFPLVFLQFPRQPRAGPVLLTLLFFPLVPLSYRVLHGSVYSFLLIRYSCLPSAGVLHALRCLRCILDVLVERDVLHIHLFSHLVLSRRRLLRVRWTTRDPASQY